MVRLFAAAALAFALLGGFAKAVVPPAPAGLDPQGTEFAIVANSVWKVRSNGQAFVPASVAYLYAAANPSSPDAAERQKRAYIWAPACTASKQTLTFKRTYFLPGRPKTVGALAVATTFDGGVGNLAISSMLITINGARFALKPGANLTLNEQERKGLASLFKFGNNVVEVTVVKRVAQGSFGKCRNGSPPRRLGIYFALYGTYEADLWFDKNGTGDEVVYRRPTSEEGQALVLGLTPNNRGPSGVYSGTARLEVTADEILTDPAQMTVTGQGLRNCVFTQPYAAVIKIACDIFRMPAGATAQVKIPLIVRFRPGYGVATVFIFREVKSNTRDLDGNSNFRRFFFKFCSQAATDPNCPPAS